MKAFVFSVMLLSSWLACAQMESPFSVQGFGTLGVARTTSNDVEYVRDLSQPRGAGTKWDGRVDSLVGVQANWQIRPNLMAVLQVVSDYRYDRSFTPEVSWAYLKYEPLPNLSMRAGRLGTEFFMMADSRQIGYSFLTVRPPGDFFWFLPFYSIDGADAAMTIPFGERLLRGKVFYGISDGSVPLADRQWKLDGSKMMGGYLEYQAGGWMFRASYANIRFKQDLPIDDVLNVMLPPAMGDATAAHLSTANTRSHYYSIGAIYDRGPWQLHFMLNHIVQGSQVFESSDSGYLLGGYRIAAVTPYIGYSWITSDSRDNAPNPVAAKIMADSHADQRTTILGARWDVVRNLALKAQWDAIRGEASSIFPYRRELPAWNGKLDVFTVTMDFVF